MSCGCSPILSDGGCDDGGKVVADAAPLCAGAPPPCEPGPYRAWSKSERRGCRLPHRAFAVTPLPTHPG
jgi:hypothetical protein